MNLKPKWWRQQTGTCQLLFPHHSYINDYTTFSDGCLGSHNDEERSEMRYVMRIAGLRESSKL